MADKRSDVSASLCVDSRPTFVSAVLSPQTVVELFYQTAARKIIISQIYCQQQSPSLLHWSHMMSSVVQLLAQLLYPSGVSVGTGSMTLLVVLMVHREHEHKLCVNSV